jgi:hypothetical protein
MDQNEGEESLIPTGMESLNNELERGGIQEGSILTVTGPGHSIGRRVCYNLCRDVPLEYFTVGHDGTRFESLLADASPVSESNISYRPIPVDNPDEALQSALSDLRSEIVPGSILLVDAINLIEEAGISELASVLNELSTIVDTTDSLAILYGIDEQGTTHENRWFTKGHTGGVFYVIHDAQNDGVSVKLRIDRLPSGQSLQDTGSDRVYEVPFGIDMGLDTTKTLSP